MDLQYEQLLCRILGKGLGCVLIKSTLGPGKTQKGWELGKGRVHGSNGGQRGQSTSNLGLRWTIPVTAGGCQVSRSRNIRGSAMYRMYCKLMPVYMLNDCSDKKIPVVHITIDRMNVAM